MYKGNKMSGNGDYVILQGPKELEVRGRPAIDVLITTTEMQGEFLSKGYTGKVCDESGAPLPLDAENVVDYAKTLKGEGDCISTSGIPKSLDCAIENLLNRYFLYRERAGWAVAGSRQPGIGQGKEVGEVELVQLVRDNLQGCGRVLFFYDDVNERMVEGLNSIVDTRYAVLETGNTSFITIEEDAVESFGEDYGDAKVLPKEELIEYVRARQRREFIATQKVSRGLIAELGKLARIEVFDTSDQS